MGRNKSTISRELSRNTGKRGYRHKQANRLTDERHQNKNKAIKLTDSVKNYIETFA
jgi:IS30 family transposase